MDVVKRRMADAAMTGEVSKHIRTIYRKVAPARAPEMKGIGLGRVFAARPGATFPSGIGSAESRDRTTSARWGGSTLRRLLVDEAVDAIFAATRKGIGAYRIRVFQVMSESYNLLNMHNYS